MKRRPLDSGESFELLRRRTRRGADRNDRFIRDRAGRDVAVFVSGSASVDAASKLREGLAETVEILVTGGLAHQIQFRIRCADTGSAEIGGRPFEMVRISY